MPSTHMAMYSSRHCACEVSCRVRAGEVARPLSSLVETIAASPQGAACGSWSSVDRWVPRLHPWFSLVSPLLGWSSALRAERVFPRLRGGPGRDANCNRECRHLLQFRAFLLVANLKKG